jgi:hypothetical protein
MEENSMTHYRLAKEVLIGNQKWDGKEDMINIVLLGLSNEIPAHDEKYELHRLLSTLLSKKLTPNEKLKIIGNEYDIPMEDGYREELGSMCNLSQGIVEEAERDMEKKIIMNMCESNFTIEQIALATRKTVDEVQAIIDSNKAVLV